MTSGGARNRSGPGKNPTSRTSERQGYVLTALPNEGYRGRAPAFPLPKIDRMTATAEGRVVNKTASDRFRKRELQVWREHWKTPQACAWSLETWRWHAVAEFCRLKTVVELEPDANASLVAQLHRFRDQIGLTPAGLRENGWAIATNEVAAKAAAAAAAAGPGQPAGDEIGERRTRRMRD